MIVSIKYYQSAVDEFAKQFAGLMNKLNGGNESDDRLMFTSADGSPINAGNIRISDAWLKDATMIAKIYNEKTGTYDYPVNLDGNAVNKLLLGMDDSVQIGKGDYEGSSYDFILFLKGVRSLGLVSRQTAAICRESGTLPLPPPGQTIPGICRAGAPIPPHSTAAGAARFKLLSL